MIYLDEGERQYFILYLFNTINCIDGYSKFYNLIHILIGDLKPFVILDYKFDSHFLTVKDETLGNDLDTLILQGFINNDRIEGDSLSHKHKLCLNDKGKYHLKIISVDKILQKKIGKKNLKKIDELLKKYNSMDIDKLITISLERQQSPNSIL